MTSLSSVLTIQTGAPVTPNPGGSQLGFKVYEELNSNGILRTFWEILRNFTYIQEFLVLLITYFW